MGSVASKQEDRNILNEVFEAGVKSYICGQNEKGECLDKENVAEEIWQYQRN
jgi:predicted peroxiredoxin